MAYTLYKSDGTLLTTITDGSVDSTTSLLLPGPNYVGYGRQLDENLVFLLENFAANVAPGGQNLQGQLWFNKSNQTLSVFTDQGYLPVSGLTVSSIQPPLPNIGNTWFNTITNQFFVYDGTEWDLIGPLYTKGQGVSGAIPVQVNDATISGVTHNIIKLTYGSTVIATISGDLAFKPSPAISGISVVNPGITFNSNISTPTINTNIVGTVTGALIGTVSGTLTGNVTGNVTGSITGSIYNPSSGVSVNVTTPITQFIGNLTGNVSGNVSSQYINATALNVTAIGSVQNLFTGTLLTTNFSTANAVITGGSSTGLSVVQANTIQTSNFSSSNVVVTGGYISNLSNISTLTTITVSLQAGMAQANNFSTANAVIAGGYINNLSNITATSAQANNFSSSNVVVTGGYISNLSNINAGTGTFTAITANTGTFTAILGNLTSVNTIVTGGNLSYVSGINNTFVNSALVNSTATTRSYSDNTSAIATTAFVQSVVPMGAIIMWGGSVASIPTGWQLCNGVNNTPDLRDRFIIGAGLTYTPGTTGGAASVTLNNFNLPGHTHTVSLSGTTAVAGGHTHDASTGITDPGHTHSLPNVFRQSSPNAFTGAGGAGQVATVTGSAFTGISATTTITGVADHTHTLALSGTTSSAGSGTAFSIMPTYYSLCYIQKMY